MTIKELAREAREWIALDMRPNEMGGADFARIARDAPDWVAHMYGWVLANHRIYDDQASLYLLDALDALAEQGDNEDPDDAQVTGDVYTEDLTRWLATHPARTEYVDIALQDYHVKTIFDALGVGQQLEREAVLDLVRDWLRTYAFEHAEPA